MEAQLTPLQSDVTVVGFYASFLSGGSLGLSRRSR